MGSPFSLPLPPFTPTQKSFIFIYSAILLKFQAQHFYMFINNNWDLNLCRDGVPFLPLSPTQKSQIIHL